MAKIEVNLFIQLSSQSSQTLAAMSKYQNILMIATHLGERKKRELFMPLSQPPGKKEEKKRRLNSLSRALILALGENFSNLSRPLG
jgi:hypothetical protein